LLVVLQAKRGPCGFRRYISSHGTRGDNNLRLASGRHDLTLIPYISTTALDRLCFLSNGASPERRAANLHRLPTAGSGSGRCGTSDGQVPGGRREVQRCSRQKHQPESDSQRCKGTPHERNGAKADQDDTGGNAHASECAEVAVLEWPDYALQARSRGGCPPPAQTSRSGVVILCVHRDASRQLWCRLSDHL
jgi:hypothetical protein